MTTLYANAEMVAVGFLGGLPGLTPGMVATQLPSDNASWAASGFVTVGPVVGGAHNQYVPMRHSVLSINTWANNQGSNKPPWGKANNLSEAIVAGCYARPGSRKIALSGAFPAAVVHQACPLGEPRRVYLDAAGFARYSFDLSVWWVQVGQLIA